MKSLYIIRDKNTGAFCSSAKNIYFNTDTNSASLFDSKRNAEKAIRTMMSFLTEQMCHYGGNTWHLTDGDAHTTFFHAFKQDYIAMLASKDHLKDHAEGHKATPEAQLDLEVVEVKLTLVG